MHRFVKFVLMAALPLALWSGQAAAQERGTAEQAKALVEKGLAHIKTVGTDKAFADFTAQGGGWQQADLYIFALKLDGTTVAHGGNKALVGKNLMQAKDANGKPYVQEMTNLVKGSGAGWIDYLRAHPQSKKIEPKSSYVMKIPDFDGFLGVGFYK